MVKPKAILCLGNTAAKGLLKPDFTMGKGHGKWINLDEHSAMATYHPSAILRQNGDIRNDLYKLLKNDMESVVDFVKNHKAEGAARA